MMLALLLPGRPDGLRDERPIDLVIRGTDGTGCFALACRAVAN
jgi:hypothetical protein